MLKIVPALIGLALLTSQPAVADEAPLKQPGRWAQDYLGRAADPDVRFGMLPNGLRYAIQHNQTPRDGVSMRLRIGSGALQEHDDEQGLAHFLEHMAFRGSTNVADGDVAKILQRQGLRFGADINANTAQDETVFQFNFPKADAASLEAGFMLFREIGSRLTLSDSAIDAERGVILSEERLRDTPGYEAQKANLGNVLAGTRAPSRWPIGLVSVIQGAHSAQLRRYYEANYRPDNATIIVVGDVDVDAIEQTIKTTFSDWTNAAKPEAFDFGAPQPVRPAAEFVAAGAPDLLTLAWTKPVDSRAETEAVDRETLLRLIALTVLNNRLDDRAAKPGAPFVSADAEQRSSLYGSADLTQIGITASPQNWRAALDAALDMQRQLLKEGVSAADLSRASAMVLNDFRSMAAQAPTRTDASIADSLVTTVNDGDLYTSAAQDLTFAEALLAAPPADAVNAALRGLFSGQGPVLFHASQKDPLTPDVLQKALAESLARPLQAQIAEEVDVWPYADFGAASAVVSRVDDKDLDATLVTFANGARLMVKTTAFEKGKIRVKVAFGHGRAGANADDARALWAAAFWPYGGTGKLSYGDVVRWAQSSGKEVSIRLAAEPRAFVLSGQTRPADLVSQLQLLAAFARDPGLRPELADKLASMAPMIPGKIDADAEASFQREADIVLAGGDLRFADLPRAEDVAQTKAADLGALLGTPGAASADIAIVGDVSVDDAIKAVAATFGAGSVGKLTSEPNVHIAMPEGRAEPWTVEHHGRADQAVIGYFYPLTDYYADPDLSRVAEVAAAILQARLVEVAREKLGLTYSPQAEAVASTELPGQGYVGAYMETPPQNFAAFHDVLAQEIASLAATPVAQDEFDRARKPLSAARAKDLENNAYWLDRLGWLLRDDRARAPVLAHASALDGVSPAAVKAFFASHVSGVQPIEIIAKAP